MKPLNHAIREARVRAGMSQADAAKESGIARSQISDLERKCHGMTLATLRALATTYGQTISELIGEVPQRERRMSIRERRAVNLVIDAIRSARRQPRAMP